ncbi:unnamed protein product [Prorocentrum cordatum]|uniref:Uncharacterized protein n=1 Tax=Prorocentrum cordatum TaxID=2364126 RepID=A0ABN9SP72_9DINO|nr:unnamed protein product [Polarella glacialis]
MRAVAAGPGVARRDVGGDVGAQLISYSAGISACEKGEQWQRALALLSTMLEAKLKPDAAVFNAGISACEKGRQWQRALALLSGISEAELDPDVIQLQCWDQRVREMRAVALGFSAAQRYVGGAVGAQRLLHYYYKVLGSARARKAGSGSRRCQCSATR